MADAPVLRSDVDGIEPADGDVVVVRAAAPDGRHVPTPALWAVIEWGTFRLLGAEYVDLPIELARAEARLLAAHRRRIAWDGSGSRLIRLRRLPLISSSPGATYWLTTDITDGADAGAVTRWQSHCHLTETQALTLLAEHGFPGALGARLLASATAATPPGH